MQVNWQFPTSFRPGVIVSDRTREAGVGPLNGVTIAVTSGPNAGAQPTSSGPLRSSGSRTSVFRTALDSAVHGIMK